MTDIPITPENSSELTALGRARWKVENETFNTLKNQGYNFEHNFGHGNKYLSTVLAMLMISLCTPEVRSSLPNIKVQYKTVVASGAAGNK